MNRKLGIVILAAGLLLLGGCKKNPTEEIHGFERWEIQNEEYLILEDGNVVQEWVNAQNTGRRYQLEDGTALMQVSAVRKLDAQSGKKGLVGLSDMSMEAQRKVMEYYFVHEEGFDNDERLKIAYQDYCSCIGKEERFLTHDISQEISPIAETETFVVFLTAVICPKEEHNTGDTITMYDSRIFRKEDAEEIPLQSLFVDDWTIVQKELAEKCGEQDTTVSESDVYDAMDCADILIFQDYLEVWFPYGTWERQEFDKGFGLKYDQLTHLMYDWAIPDKAE